MKLLMSFFIVLSAGWMLSCSPLMRMEPEPTISQFIESPDSKIESIADTATLNFNDSTVGKQVVVDENYTLRIHRPKSGFGSAVNYDLYLGDLMLTRVFNGLDTTFVLKRTGMNNLWARTQNKIELFVNFEAGRSYDVRCGIVSGFFMGNPIFIVTESTLNTK